MNLMGYHPAVGNQFDFGLDVLVREGRQVSVLSALVRRGDRAARLRPAVP
jgi:hypothetical protein